MPVSLIPVSYSGGALCPIGPKSLRVRRGRRANRPHAWTAIGGALLCIFMSAFPSFAQTYTTLASFDGSNGKFPGSQLVQGLDGNLYGTTDTGGPILNGVVFRIPPKGTLTTVYSFCAQIHCYDGSGPSALMLARDGIFYGLTGSGGAKGVYKDGGDGTFFKITPTGALTTLHDFCLSCGEGAIPYGPMAQSPSSN